MINRKSLKRDALFIFKNNYLKMVIISLIGFFIMGTHINMSTPFNSLSNYNSNSNINETLYCLNNINDVEEIIFQNTNISSDFKNSIYQKIIDYSPNNSLLSIYYNNIKDNIFNTNIINIFLNSLTNITTISYLMFIIVILILTLIQIFVRNILAVGEARFFLECRKYKKTTILVLLMPYNIKNGYKSGVTLLIKSIYQFLWNLTIIGGIIKYYTYYLIPFLLAENPTLGINESIKISKNLMDGNKWEVFKLELSFIGLKFLSIFTFGFLSIFYINPYIYATKSELYMNLRKKALSKDRYKYAFIDIELDSPGDYYPIEKYPLEIKNNFKTNSNYNRQYSLMSLSLIFLGLSIFGWFWEVSLHLIKYGKFVNRGLMSGPWLPLYGSGAIIMLVLTKKYNKSIVKTFILCMILSGMSEYLSATLLWERFHMKWWDYSDYFLNLNSRIYLEGLIAFAIGGVAIIYIIAPIIDIFYKKHSIILKKILLIIIVIFLVDFIYSLNYPNYGEGINDYSLNIQESPSTD